MIQLKRVYFALQQLHNNTKLAIIYIALASYTTLALASRPRWGRDGSVRSNLPWVWPVRAAFSTLASVRKRVSVTGWINNLATVVNGAYLPFSDASTAKLLSVLRWNDASSSVRAKLDCGRVVVRVRRGGQPTKRCGVLSKTSRWRGWLVKCVCLKYRVGLQPRHCCSS